MTYALLKSLAIGMATMIAAAYSPTPELRAKPATIGCLQFSDVDSALALHDAKALVSDPRFAKARITPGFPSVVADSVTFYSNAAACDTAANRFRLARIAGGEADVLWPVLLIRLGPSNRFVATSLMRQSRDYVLLDSLMHYIGEFNIR